MIRWSRKQAWLYSSREQADIHTYAVHGPVRSGKTMCTVHGFCDFAAHRYAGHTFLVASRSARQLNSVVIQYMREYARERKMTLRRNDDHYLLPSMIGSPNRFFPLVGNDSSAADRASGFTAAGALLDEAHAMPADFIAVCRERTSSVPGSKFVGIANPQGPKHPYKTELIDVADGVEHVELGFELADNETLTERELSLLHRIYPPGPLRDRRIFGKWVATRGMVYPFFEDAICTPPKSEQPYRYSVSIDHADSGVTHAVRAAWYPSGIWLDKEWRHDGAADGPLLEVAQAQRVYRTLARGVTVADWIVDPAAMEFQVALGNLLGRRVTPALNDVLLGIEKTSEWMAGGVVHISPACKELISEMHEYVWDPEAAKRGEDKPVKAKDHGCDAFRYFCFTTAGKQAVAASRPRVVRARRRGRVRM